MAPNSQSTDGLVSLRGVSKSFDEGEARHRVLENIDLDIEAGTFTAVLGRSGSGKSTLLNLISGIDAPDEGSVSVAGVSLDAISEQERSLFRRRHIGFVFQFFNLLPTLTVAENIELPRQLNRMNGSGTTASELLARVGLEDRADTFPDRLSGGEQQRVAIARALAHDPELLLADEPTGNLDVGIGRDILDLLLRLARDEGKTLLVATHSHEVATSADRVLRVIDHSLVEVPKDEL